MAKKQPKGGPRKIRADIARDTLTILERGSYHYHCVDDEEGGEEDVVVSIAEQQRLAVSNTILYTPEATTEMVKIGRSDKKSSDNGIETTYEVNDLTSLDAVRKLGSEEQEEGFETTNSFLCLNFASAKNPGGGFLNGAQAQEESIARASGLYPCLIQKTVSDYYTSNQAAKAPFYTDHIIYSPNVPVFKNEDGSLMKKPVLVSFITAPAVNVSAARGDGKKKGKNENSNIATEVEAAMRRRIASVLHVAQNHGHECLVLGAWGCGVFGNDPKDIAHWFSEELVGGGLCFRKVVFPIYSSSEDKNCLKAFQYEFNNNNSNIIIPRATTATTDSSNSSNGDWTSQPLAVEYIPPTPENTLFEQRLYLLIGLPGSGKSTFSQALEEGMPYKFVRVNQDELKTRKHCETKVKSILAGNNTKSKPPNCAPNVIIDRCNFDLKQRSTWLEIAHSAKLPVHVIYFAVPVNECIRRCQSRKKHETVQPRDASRVVAFVKNHFELPNKVEEKGFDGYTTIQNKEEFNDTILMLLNSK